MIIHDRLRSRAAHLDLRTHLLQTRSERFNLSPLLRDSRLEVLLLLRETCLQRLNSPMVRRRWIVTYSNRSMTCGLSGDRCKVPRLTNSRLGLSQCYHREADLCGVIKGKIPAGKRLCHQLAISTATQIQSSLFLLAAAQLPQQAARVAISIPAWTWIEFSCFPTRN